ncbi:nucleolin-like [Nymphalis io]|uniref:nucleolin-like n=1 Tax=Inachis io TaxID=171585 RepID=UPI002169897D|nr:nucleolin-like [Nymphalis io]
MLIYCDLETGPGTYRKTMIVKSQQEVNIEPESSSESSSEDESIPPMDSMHKYYYDKATAGSLVQNMCNLSVESEDDDDDDLTPTPARKSPPHPFESEDYSEDSDSDNSEIEKNEQETESADDLVFNNPTWYEQIRQYLAERVRDDLWEKTQWIDKCYWDDSDDADADADDDDAPAPPVFLDHYSIQLI